MRKAGIQQHGQVNRPGAFTTRTTITITLPRWPPFPNAAPGLVQTRSDYLTRWSSSVGRRLPAARLSVGTNLITLRVSQGDLTGTASIQLNILRDTDGDGLADDIENQHAALDPNDPDDAFRDSDGDGLTDAAEILDLGTQPFNPDSDSDGLSDGEEIAQQLNPEDNDADRDGVLDGQDNCPFVFNPLQSDVDQNGVGDACEPSPEGLRITSIQWSETGELWVGFEPLPGTLAYRYVLESAPTVLGPWEVWPEATVRRAAPPAAFALVASVPNPQATRFIRVRKAE